MEALAKALAGTSSLERALAELDCSIVRSLAEKDELRERLRLVIRAASEHIDGDSQPSDTHWSEIIGIAEGDPNWVQHAKANYST
jgi:hypothetical protein